MDFDQWKKAVEDMGGLNAVKSSAKNECKKYQSEESIREFQEMVARNPMFSGIKIDTETVREFFKQMEGLE